MNPERMRWPTITLRGDAQGIVHLESELPEVIAMGHESWQEFKDGKFPLGGPHAEVEYDIWRGDRVTITTPECTFTYTIMGAHRDVAGPYYLLRRTFVSSGYAAWVNSRG